MSKKKTVAEIQYIIWCKRQREGNVHVMTLWFAVLYVALVLSHYMSTDARRFSGSQCYLDGYLLLSW